MRLFLAILALSSLVACDVAVGPGSIAPAPALPSPEQAARNFVAVKAAVEPVAEAECRRRTRGVNCDFLIAVDPDRSAPPNAFQSLDETGRPVITFTIKLIARAFNADELAFVMGHEAAHHVAGHLARQRATAETTAAVFAGLAVKTGATAIEVVNAQRLGAAVGARVYSKEFELEADELGTIITYRAGYNPLVGAEFFGRIPDPGDRFLGTHPPNSARLEAVRRTSRALGLKVE